MPNFLKLEHAAFRAQLQHFLHPRTHLTIPAQMKGRDIQLRSMLDCFETPGAQAFIWGPRGVGKTSLGHTSCEAHSEFVEAVGDIPCYPNLTFSEFMKDVVRKVHHKGYVDLRSNSFIENIQILGLSINPNPSDVVNDLDIQSISHASALINTLFNKKCFPYKKPVIIVDEFDTIQNHETIEQMSFLLKQLSVDASPLKFVFCGVANDLSELKMAHESVERYVYAIELRPLAPDAIWAIVEDVAKQFDIEFPHGQIIRISQISAGYPHFTHLILQNIIVAAYHAKFEKKTISLDLFKSGVHTSAEQAATRLRNAYEKATKKGTDRYVEVLWAVANGPMLERQFKDIYTDYQQIMSKRPHRESLGGEQSVRNHLNSLCKEPNGSVLSRRPPGWYQFTDSMFRSYVRMIAESENVELGDESFHD